MQSSERYEVATRYERYKVATKEVMKFLEKAAPPGPKSIQTLEATARRVTREVPLVVLGELWRAITLRKKSLSFYSKQAVKENESDAKHAYLIQQLEKVWTILRKRQHPRQPEDDDDEDDEEDGFFAALHSNAIEEEEEEDQEENELDRWVGLTVRLEGLIRKPEFNGREGFVSRSLDSGRLKVLSREKEISVKPENCVAVKTPKKENKRDPLRREEERQGWRAGAMWLLMELEVLLEEISKVWKAYAKGEMSLVAAAQCTNFCIGHANRVAQATELEFPELATLERVIAATYLADAVDLPELLSCDDALGLVVDVVFGDDEDPGFDLSVDEGQQRHREVRVQCLYMTLELQEFDADDVVRAVASVKRRLPGIDDDQARSIIFKIAEIGVHRFVGTENPETNELCYGPNGIVGTSEIIRRSRASGKLNPRGWNLSTMKGWLGPAWDEITNPADETNALDDYLESFISSCEYFARNDSPELVESLHVPELIPLWALLREGGHAITMVIAFHACLLSLVHVNSPTDRGCRHVMMTSRSYIKDLRRQTNHDFQEVKTMAAAFKENIVENAMACLERRKVWIEKLESCYKNKFEVDFDPGDVSYKYGDQIPEGYAVESTNELMRKSRDEVLLLNPYVAGQTALATCVSMLECGLFMIDCVGQARFVLHCYSALESVGALEKSKLLELLATVLGGDKATSIKAKHTIWPNGNRPKGNFLVAWDKAISPDRRTVSVLDPSEVSPAFRLSVKGDFSGDELSRGGCSELERALRALRDAIDNDDLLLKINLVPVAIKFLKAAEELPADLDLLTELQTEQRQRERIHRGHSARRHAGHMVVTDSLLSTAEYFGQGDVVLGPHNRRCQKDKQAHDAHVARIRGKGDSDDVREKKLQYVKERAAIFLNSVTFEPPAYPFLRFLPTKNDSVSTLF